MITRVYKIKKITSSFTLSVVLFQGEEYVYLYFFRFITKQTWLQYISNIIDAVKKEVEKAKYSKLIIYPLIKYIYFRIKRKLV